MFEVIGILVVCWIGFAILRGFFRAASTVRSKEYGMEARHIAVRELCVPEAYYNHLTVSSIDRVKNSAVLLRDTDTDFRNVSWPRLLSLVIYGEFHKDCEQWKAGNPIQEQLFNRLGVMPNIIANELERDPRQVIYGTYVRLDTEQEQMTDDSIKELIRRCAEKRDREFQYPGLAYERISDFASAHNADCEWFPNYRGMRFWIDLEAKSYAVYVQTIDPSKEDQSGVVVSARMEESAPVANSLA